MPAAPLPAASLVLNTGSHNGPLRRVALDAAGRAAVTASDDKTAIVWQLDGLRPRHVLRVPVAGGEIGRLYGAAWDPTSKLVALAGTSAATGRRRPSHLRVRRGRRQFRARVRCARRRCQAPGLVGRRPFHRRGLRARAGAARVRQRRDAVVRAALAGRQLRPEPVRRRSHRGDRVRSARAALPCERPGDASSPTASSPPRSTTRYRCSSRPMRAGSRWATSRAATARSAGYAAQAVVDIYDAA